MHAGQRALEALVGTNHTDVVPHQSPKFVPVVRYDDHLVGIGRASGLPLWQLDGGRFHGMGEYVFGGAVGIDERLEQGVAGEPVRPVQPGAGHFADRVQPGQIRLAVFADPHAAALVMRSRHDRDRFLGDVDAVAEAGSVDVREPIHQEPRRLVGDVEQCVVIAAAFHFAVDRPCHDVARRERLERMHLLHESLPAQVEQFAALAAHRFADEKRLGFGMVQAGWVKLDELHVGDGRPGPVCHRDAVAGGDVGI